MMAFVAAAESATGDFLMKHFLLEGQHLVPFEQRDPALIAAHRQFLQQGYDQGRFLLSGPSIPPAGGILIARAQSRGDERDARRWPTSPLIVGCTKRQTAEKERKRRAIKSGRGSSCEIMSARDQRAEGDGP